VTWEEQQLEQSQTCVEDGPWPTSLNTNEDGTFLGPWLVTQRFTIRELIRCAIVWSKPTPPPSSSWPHNFATMQKKKIICSITPKEAPQQKIFEGPKKIQKAMKPDVNSWCSRVYSQFGQIIY